VGVDAQERDIPPSDIPPLAALALRIAPRKEWVVSFQHEAKDGKVVSLPWPDESAGTCRFFSLLGPALLSIHWQGVICIDELDTSLHPSLVAEFLRLFYKLKGDNPGAQLLFTTHNPLLLDTRLLRRDQIWFADKDREGASFLYPLTDYKPRVDEPLVRGYLSGRYGAVPFIPKGLVAELPPAEAQTAGKPEAADAR
jgi:AAA15 family ATPase/GTPase